MPEPVGVPVNLEPQRTVTVDVTTRWRALLYDGQCDYFGDWCPNSAQFICDLSDMYQECEAGQQAADGTSGVVSTGSNPCCDHVCDVRAPYPPIPGY